jgi:hypothetical protein
VSSPAKAQLHECRAPIAHGGPQRLPGAPLRRS